MNKSIKRRYFDFRTGNTTLSPILQFSNFMMLAYLTINEIIPIWLFAPLFIVAILVTFTLVGNYFRKIQTPTDITMSYEKSVEAARTVYEIEILALELLLKDRNIPIPQEFKTRKEYMKKIMENKV